MMDQSAIGLDVFFLLVGAILVFSMHGGFAFLELGTVRGKNQVNAMVKIIVDFAFSTLAYFFIGYWIAYGVTFFAGAQTLSGDRRDGLRAAGPEPGQILLPRDLRRGRPRDHFGRHRRAREVLAAGGDRRRHRRAGLSRLSEGIVWNGNYGIQAWLEATFGARFHDFAGSIVVHAVGGWLALAAVLTLGARTGRYGPNGRPFPPSSIPWLGLGTWLLCIGWFGFNVMSAQSTAGVSGLVALNSLLAMVGGIVAAAIAGKVRPRLRPQWRAGRAGRGLRRLRRDAPDRRAGRGRRRRRDLRARLHLTQERLKIDDVLGVWPLHGLCGLWGGIACGIFGLEALGGMGGVSPVVQIVGSVRVSAYALAAGVLVYAIVKRLVGIRLTDEQQRRGADLSIHSIGATPEDVAEANGE